MSSDGVVFCVESWGKLRQMVIVHPGERHICFELCTLCYDIPRRAVSNFVAGMYNVVCIAKGVVLFLCRE